ncbi:MAG: bifunctional serine/threonine-protein kinase/formylglycine-generating enzyme family protein, partial [Myxococcota bacterium]
MEPTLPNPILELLLRHGVTASEALSAELGEYLSGSAPGAVTVPAEAIRSQDTWTDEAVPGPAVPRALPDRYRPLGTIGVGGMGQVLRVHDGVLGRAVAMKIAHPELSIAGRSRFLAEAQVLAQLQHPGIVPVFDLGALPTGEVFFTMPIVAGRTLGERIRDEHGPRSSPFARPVGHRFPEGAAIRRLVVAFHDVADAMGHAHARGVVHRDLKPDNIVVGDHGATVIVDWGLAKVIGAPEPDATPVSTSRTADPRGTLDGVVIGTLGYMPPEQAKGDRAAIDARADVHALGATLWEILCGAPPRPLDDGGPPEEPPPLVPAELVELARRCLAEEPARRPPNAGEVAREVDRWLDGTHRRERALAEVDAADRAVTEIARLRAAAEADEAEATRRLAAIPPHAPEGDKHAAWRLQDAAAAARAEAHLREIHRVEALAAALRTDPTLVEAHDRLAEHWRSHHALAEAAGDTPRSAELLHLVRTHDVRGVHARYIDGAGAVTVLTDPPGATVEVLRYEVHDRRLVAVPDRVLGTTPLRDVPLPMGRYRLDLRAPGRATVRYPVALGRNAQWDGVPPGDTAPRPIPVPLASALGPDDRYVPAGWFVTGGDPLSEWPRPAERVWLDGFVIRRVPVTNADFVAFLDDLVATGREAEAEAVAPRFGTTPVYGRTADGRFALRPDPDGDEWLPDHPVVLVDWDGARAYAAWEAARTGQPWRLPFELEREKAARGVDGRTFPWGAFFDPSWCCMRESHVHQPLPERVGTRPVDEGPYGAVDLAGNVHEWCADVFDPAGPRAPGPAAPLDRSGLVVDGGDDVGRSLRGGSWHSGERWARSA